MISLLFHDSAMLLHAYSQLYTTTSPGLVLLFAGPRGEGTCQGTKNSLVWKKKSQNGFPVTFSTVLQGPQSGQEGKKGTEGVQVDRGAEAATVAQMFISQIF